MNFANSKARQRWHIWYQPLQKWVFEAFIQSVRNINVKCVSLFHISPYTINYLGSMTWWWSLRRGILTLTLTTPRRVQSNLSEFLQSSHIFNSSPIILINKAILWSFKKTEENTCSGMIWTRVEREWCWGREPMGSCMLPGKSPIWCEGSTIEIHTGGIWPLPL